MRMLSNGTLLLLIGTLAVSPTRALAQAHPTLLQLVTRIGPFPRYPLKAVSIKSDGMVEVTYFNYPRYRREIKSGNDYFVWINVGNCETGPLSNVAFDITKGKTNNPSNGCILPRYYTGIARNVDAPLSQVPEIGGEGYHVDDRAFQEEHFFHADGTPVLTTSWFTGAGGQTVKTSITYSRITLAEFEAVMNPANYEAVLSPEIGDDAIERVEASMSRRTEQLANIERSQQERERRLQQRQAFAALIRTAGSLAVSATSNRTTQPSVSGTTSARKWGQAANQCAKIVPMGTYLGEIARYGIQNLCSLPINVSYSDSGNWPEGANGSLVSRIAPGTTKESGIRNIQTVQLGVCTVPDGAGGMGPIFYKGRGCSQ